MRRRQRSVNESDSPQGGVSGVVGGAVGRQVEADGGRRARHGQGRTLPRAQGGGVSRAVSHGIAGRGSELGRGHHRGARGRRGRTDRGKHGGRETGQRGAPVDGGERAIACPHTRVMAEAGDARAASQLRFPKCLVPGGRARLRSVAIRRGVPAISMAFT